MKGFHKFTCINNDFEAKVNQEQIGREYSYYYKQRCTHILKIFAVVKCLPCFTIIADTGKLKDDKTEENTFEILQHSDRNINNS